MKNGQKGTGIRKQVFMNQRYFKFLSEVLGKKRALRELRKVAKSSSRLSANADFPEFGYGPSSLGGAFIWINTPQGMDFWKRVERAVAAVARNQGVSY